MCWGPSTGTHLKSLEPWLQQRLAKHPRGCFVSWACSIPLTASTRGKVCLALVALS